MNVAEIWCLAITRGKKQRKSGQIFLASIKMRTLLQVLEIKG